MNIQNIIEEHPAISITLSAEDLKGFGRSIAEITAAAILDKQEERLFTRQEVLQQLGVSAATLWRWNRLGILKAKKIGNKVFYSEASIKEMVKEDPVKEAKEEWTAVKP